MHAINYYEPVNMKKESVCYHAPHSLARLLNLSNASLMARYELLVITHVYLNHKEEFIIWLCFT